MKDEYRRIYAAVAAIPRGRVASYGEIAARAGLPRRARLVGHLLREAPDELQLPWYRVVRADGHLACMRGAHEQARRLRAEGVEVRNDRVPMGTHGLDHDLDREIWGGLPDQPLPRRQRLISKSAQERKNK